MKSSAALCSLLLALGACADEAAPTDARDASFLLAAKADGTGLDEGSVDACSALAAANRASAAELDDDAGIDARAVSGIIAGRPFTTLAALDAVAYVGPVAFGRLVAFADDAGYACGAPAAATCSAKGGTYDGVTFTAAAECKAVAFLNGARMSDMAALPDVARRVAYDHCPTGEPCTGYRFSGWASAAEFAAWPKIAGAAMKALASASAGWTAGGPAWDTVADVWARRSAMSGAPVTFEKVFVTKGGIVESGASTYACVEVRDAPDAVNYIDACVQQIVADSASACANQPTRCLAPFVGQWVWMRGTVRKTTAHAGGYKVNLTSAGPHDANPALLATTDPGPGTSGGVDDAWRSAAIDDATRLVTDGPLPAQTPAASMPAAAQARVAALGDTSEVSVIETYALTVQGHPLYLVLATDGSGEGNLVWVDLVDETGRWFAHAIAFTLWDGGGGLDWGLNDEDTTVCKCGAAGAPATCTWLDGTTVASKSIACP